MIPNKEKRNLTSDLKWIEDKLRDYEYFTDAELPQILELAINGNHNTSIDVILEDQVIVPCVLSYLTWESIVRPETEIRSITLRRFRCRCRGRCRCY
jgi:hypothetical protein